MGTRHQTLACGQRVSGVWKGRKEKERESLERQSGLPNCPARNNCCSVVTLCPIGPGGQQSPPARRVRHTRIITDPIIWPSSLYQAPSAHLAPSQNKTSTMLETQYLHSTSTPISRLSRDSGRPAANRFLPQSPVPSPQSEG